MLKTKENKDIKLKTDSTGLGIRCRINYHRDANQILSLVALQYFHMCLILFIARAYRAHVCWFLLCTGLRSSLCPLLFVIIVLMIMCVSL